MRVISYATIVFVWLGALYIALETTPEKRKVNCSLVEISPDFTPEMRQACRERMRHKL